VGIGQALRLVRATEDARPASRPDAVRSPWTVGGLSTVVWSDLFGADASLPVMRADAIALPPVARARDILTATLARCPLDAYRDDVKLTGTDAPTWTYRTDGRVSPYHRMLWTVDDLLFTGWSLWARANDSDGFMVDAERVPVEDWDFTADGTITVHGAEVNAADVVLIPGPHEGILERNGRAIRAAGALDRAYLSTARNPTPDLELHQTGGIQLDREEITTLLNDWRTARQADGGSVAYTPETIEARVHGKSAETLLIDGRNAAAVDMARICDVPAALVDATNAGASLTYETTAGRNLEFLDYGVELYLAPIEARLSMDDVVPRGQRIAFDRSPLTSLTTITAPARQD
jgi:hypothetical protein